MRGGVRSKLVEDRRGRHRECLCGCEYPRNLSRHENARLACHMYESRRCERTASVVRDKRGQRRGCRGSNCHILIVAESHENPGVLSGPKSIGNVDRPLTALRVTPEQLHDTACRGSAVESTEARLQERGNASGVSSVPQREALDW